MTQYRCIRCDARTVRDVLSMPGMMCESCFEKDRKTDRYELTLVFDLVNDDHNASLLSHFTHDQIITAGIEAFEETTDCTMISMVKRTVADGGVRNE